MLVALSSIPVDVNEVNVPTDVILGCAAVAKVPVIFPDDCIVPVILMFPVPVISFEFKSRLPPKDGETSQTTSVKAVSTTFVPSE